MDLKGKKFLVIGGAGLIGSHVVDALLREEIAEVRVYDNFTRGSRGNLANALSDKRCSVFSLGGDILHKDILEEAMDGIDGVFHLAAMWLLHCQDYPRSAFEVNVAGTFNVLDAVIRRGVKKIVFSSSASVYGDAERFPMDEDHPFRNNTFYGATKIAGEQMLKALHQRYRKTDQAFDYAGLRYMNVYGPRQDYRGAYIAVIMKMLDRIDQGLAPQVFGDGSQTYDFVYVGDCARANVCAMRAAQPAAADAFYNVGTGIPTTIKTLAEITLRITGAKTGIEYLPAGQTFVTQRVGCTKKAEREIGFRAQVSLEEGLRNLIEWRMAHKEEVEHRKQAV